MSMDSTVLSAIYGGVFALIGSAIGGWASYQGSKSAAKDSIEAQKELIKQQRKERKYQDLKLTETSAI